ncbi:MAG: hypothetical protein ACR2F8_13860 [Caulobacteraceae bacterium]
MVGGGRLIAGGVASALRFVATAWRGAWAVLLLTAVTIGGFLTAVAWGEAAAWRGAWLAAAVLVATIARGALYRLALGLPGVGPGGLQWRRAEGRLIAVWLLAAVFLFILGLLAFVAFIASAYAVASAGAGFVATEPATWAPAVDGRGRFVVGAVGVAGAAALSWAALRLSLAAAASVARGRIQVLSAWPLTRRCAGRLGLALAVIAAPPALLLAALSVAGGVLKPAPLVAVGFAQGLILAGLWLPTTIGLMAYLYRRADSAAREPPP